MSACRSPAPGCPLPLAGRAPVAFGRKGRSIVTPHRQRRQIAIVGAGFTGSMLAAHLLRSAEGPLSIQLVERAGEPGAGLAYSTPNSGHLLNVRAYNMSVFPDDPRHFLRWLWSRDDGGLVPPSGHAFVSRAVYGAYVQDVLRQARAAASPGVTLTVVKGEAVDIDTAHPAVWLRLADGTALAADHVALCLGHFPPSPPAGATAGLVDSDRFIGDPWDVAAVSRIGRDEPVLIVGTGLTMVDTVLSLQDQGHRGPVTAVSRRGLLPHVHEEVRPYKSFVCPDVLPGTVLDVLIALKADVRRAREAGYDWRSAFDALRPHHHSLWKALPLEERRRFLRHARPFWDVHRHRMAPEVAVRIRSAIADGWLTVAAGRLQALDLAPDGVDAVVAARGTGRVWTWRGGAVVNATGTECDFARIRHPLVRALIERGLARPDALRLGLDVTEEGALLDRDGAPSTRLTALGPVAKAPFWEMVAVPELRNQCAAAGRRLAAGPSQGFAAPVAGAGAELAAGPI